MSDAICDAEAALDELVQDLSSVGFQNFPNGECPRREELSNHVPLVRPSPLPKRPKGRLFVGAVLIIVCSAAAYQGVAFLRYSAYGTVAGRVIDVSAPFEAAVRFVHVQEGDSVEQGQLLMTLENVALEHRLREVQDELRVVQATLTAEMSKVHWNFDEHFDRSQRAAADYYSSWGELLNEQAILDQLKLDFRRAKQLKEQNAVTQAEFDEAYHAALGQYKKVKKLAVALEELKSRWETQNRSRDDGYSQLEPTLARIQMLQRELARLRQQLSRGEIRAPVNGVVAKRHCFAGEQVEAQQQLFSILEEGSLNITMYMPQKSSEKLLEGSEVQVAIEPHAFLVTCCVVRFGDTYEPAPNHIARYYRKDEMLLPVYLQPKDDQLGSLALRVGSVAKLPRFLLSDLGRKLP